jgi:anti-sigma factor RsiW
VRPVRQQVGIAAGYQRRAQTVGEAVPEPHHRRGLLLVGTAIVLTGFNLRTAVGSVGPVLEEIEHGLHVSSGLAGLITSMPVICFAVIGFAGPPLAARFRDGHVLAGALTAMAAGLVLGIVLGGSGTGYLAWRQGQDRSADALLTSHLRALQPGHLIDVPTSDRHEVKPWFDGRVDYAPPVKDLGAAGFPLLGGRLDYAEGRDVAVIVYGRRKHSIDLYVWPMPPGASPTASAYREAGYNMRRWTEDGFVLWAVSDLNGEELDAFVDAWRRTE